MKKRKYYCKSRFLILILILSIISLGFIEGDKKGNKKTSAKIYKNSSTQVSGKQGDSYRLKINNISLPLNRKGVIAEVNIPPEGSNGRYNGKVFLFSSGFFLSGYANGQLFSNAVASASLVEDYVPGTVANGQNDSRAQLYVLNAQDVPFSQSWQDWTDAVALGADFIDGDNDGVYNPVDKNGNGQWDPDEDMPDLLGDETVWTIYNDGLGAPQRRWNTVSPLGIEVRQTVFGFASAGPLGNIVFVRYRFKYVGLGQTGEPDVLDDVYFGVWADSDIGEGSSDAADDLVGSDTLRNAGYTYNNGSDGDWGTNPPCFMIDFFSGPAEYLPGETFTDINGNGEYDDGIDTPLDTAFSYRGLIKGIRTLPGAKNLPISSFIQYRNGDPTLNDPDNSTEARNYITGRNRTGEVIDPCTFAYGAVRGGVVCDSVNPYFWYSGDPVANNGTGIGWINTVQADTRQMTNTGPFKLRKGEEKEIVVAYVVGQGNDPLSSITVARNIDDGAQIVFNNNFLAPSPPPQPQIEVSTGEDFIDLSWETPKQVNYLNKTGAYDLKFEGYRVWAFKTSSPADFINSQQNSTVVTSFSLKNFIKDVYVQNSRTGGIELVYPDATVDHQLDSALYTDPVTGRIRVRISNDPFNSSQPLIKGKPYYFAVTSYGFNYSALVNKDGSAFGDTANYYLSSSSFVQEVENIKNVRTIVMGENLYSPPIPLSEGTHVLGGSGGSVEYDVVNKEDLTGDTYKVNFIIDSTTNIYSTYWRLANQTTGSVLVDTSKKYLYGSELIDLPITEGFIVKLSQEVPHLDTSLSYQLSTPWIDTTSSKVYYLSTDISEKRRLPSTVGGNLGALNGNYIKADKLRRVELRFGENGKAYRYLNGFFGNNASQQQRYFKYAAAITGADTVGKGAVGNWDAANNRANGFVDVPFTAWIKDFEFGEERQLAVGFIERRASYGGNPDGVWDPGVNIELSGEYILIFNSSYDPNGSQLSYVGGFQDGNSTIWADLNGGGTAFYPLPPSAPYSPEERAIASSPFFNTLYAIRLEKNNLGDTFSQGDKVVVNLSNYPYTPVDEYTFTTSKNGELTDQQKKELFNKVNVFPNPMYGYNVATSYTNSSPDDPFVTFSNLPEDITIKIYSLSGTHLRTLTNADKSSLTSPFLQWDLHNESGLRVASGLYIAIVSSPLYGEKVLKFSIIMPQKQLPRY